MATLPDLAFLTDGSHEQAVFVTHRAARAARSAPLPEGLAAPLAAALEAAGLHELYTHQREAFDLLAGGANVVISTGTASGKSLCFMLPVLQALADDPQARALFLYPTKALAQDQARQIAALRPRSVAVSLYDGDTPQAQRAAIRKRAAIVLSNPDMLHMGVLPGHEQWAEFLHHLRYVVVDEAHVYRGVFGSHVAQVLRRLRRLSAVYGARPPRFVLSSATMASPQPFAEELVGLPFAAVTESGAPVVEQTIVLWNPPLEDPALGQRKSALAEVSYLVSESVLRGARVIAFAPTRKATELVYQHVKRRLDDRRRDASEKVLPYRAGYTPQQRRDIERKLFDGELSAVVTTDALELGIDVGSLDLALVTGFPGTVMSLLQRWGRAGRRGKGHAVMVAGQDALDQYFMREPERLLSRAVEEAIVDLTNPHILEAHLGAAAYERPLTDADEAYFGEVGMARAAQMAASGRLRRRTDSAGHETLAWSAPHSPAPKISLRSASTDDFVIVETREGSVLGSVDRERVFRVAHPGAVYLHLGQSYLVTRLDLEQRTVLVDEFRGSHYTQPKVDKEVTIAGSSPLRPLGEGAFLHFGTIDVTEQVIAYRKRELTDGRVIDTVSLDLPRQTFSTEAVWFTVPAELVRAKLDDGAELGALHAAEHACIAVLPLFAMCDRWDIGGLSTNWHWQTDQATIFIYDGYPGGIGLARRAADAFEQLAADARLLVSECPCEAGCPSCVQSPKCGNLNEPLSKEGAVALLGAILAKPAPISDEKVGT
jgi:DEAD/DEAH box helicase domain-containing protein